METKNKDYFCVILAGGKGRRLWPTSRTDLPKQFIDFFGTGRTLIQQSYDRFKRFIPEENIYVSTEHEYVSLVKEQLPMLDSEHLLVEPVNRNTAGSVAWAVLNIQKREENASIIIVPSDQYITGEDAFKRNILDGLELVGQKDMVFHVRTYRKQGL